MGKHHKFVFNEAERTFVGKFEDMYAAESREKFDSWLQEDTRKLRKRVALDILEDYNFQRIADVGCGKGAFTHLLKKKNNHVTGVDVSETAVAVARSRYPDISFVTADLARQSLQEAIGSEKFDLTLVQEVLSYLPNWEFFLQSLSEFSRYALVTLFIPPPDSMGFVKSQESLLSCFQKYFSVIQEVRLVTDRQIVLFGETKATSA